MVLTIPTGTNFICSFSKEIFTLRVQRFFYGDSDAPIEGLAVEVNTFMSNALLAYAVTEGGPFVTNVRYCGLVTDAGGAINIFVQTTDGRRTTAKDVAGEVIYTEDTRQIFNRNDIQVTTHHNRLRIR